MKKLLLVLFMLVTVASLANAQSAIVYPGANPNVPSFTINADRDTTKVSNGQVVPQFYIAEPVPGGYWHVNDQIIVTFTNANFSFVTSGNSLTKNWTSANAWQIQIKGGGGLTLDKGATNSLFTYSPSRTEGGAVVFTVTQASASNPDTIFFSNVLVANALHSTSADTLIFQTQRWNGEGYNPLTLVPGANLAYLNGFPGAPYQIVDGSQYQVLLGPKNMPAFSPLFSSLDIDTLHAGQPYDPTATPDTLAIEDQWGNVIAPSQDNFTLSATTYDAASAGNIVTGTLHPAANLQNLQLDGYGTGRRIVRGFYIERATYLVAANHATSTKQYIQFGAAGLLPLRSSTFFHTRVNLPSRLNITDNISGNDGTSPDTLVGAGTTTFTLRAYDYWLNSIPVDSLDTAGSGNYGATLSVGAGNGTVGVPTYNADGSILFGYTAPTNLLPRSVTFTASVYAVDPLWPVLSASSAGSATATFSLRIIQGTPFVVGVIQMNNVNASSLEVPVATGTTTATRSVVTLKAFLFDQWSNKVTPTSATQVSWAQVTSKFDGTSFTDAGSGSFVAGSQTLSGDTLIIQYTVPTKAFKATIDSTFNAIGSGSFNAGNGVTKLDSNWIRLSVTLPTTSSTDFATIGVYSGPIAQQAFTKWGKNAVLGTWYGPAVGSPVGLHDVTHDFTWQSGGRNRSTVPDTLIVTQYSSDSAMMHNKHAGVLTPPINRVDWNTGFYASAFVDTVYDVYGNLINFYRYPGATVTYSLDLNYAPANWANTQTSSVSDVASLTKLSATASLTKGIKMYGVMDSVHVYSGKIGGYGQYAGRGKVVIKATFDGSTFAYFPIQVVNDDIDQFFFTNYNVNDGTLTPVTTSGGRKIAGRVPAGTKVFTGVRFYDRYANPVQIDQSKVTFTHMDQVQDSTLSGAATGNYWETAGSGYTKLNYATAGSTSPVSQFDTFGGDSANVYFGWRTAFQASDSVVVRVTAESYRATALNSWADTVAVTNNAPAPLAQIKLENVTPEINSALGYSNFSYADNLQTPPVGGHNIRAASYTFWFNSYLFVAPPPAAAKAPSTSAISILQRMAPYFVRARAYDAQGFELRNYTTNVPLQVLNIAPTQTDYALRDTITVVDSLNLYYYYRDASSAKKTAFTPPLGLVLANRPSISAGSTVQVTFAPSGSTYFAVFDQKAEGPEKFTLGPQSAYTTSDSVFTVLPYYLYKLNALATSKSGVPVVNENTVLVDTTRVDTVVAWYKPGQTTDKQQPFFMHFNKFDRFGNPDKFDQAFVMYHVKEGYFDFQSSAEPNKVFLTENMLYDSTYMTPKAGPFTPRYDKIGISADNADNSALNTTFLASNIDLGWPNYGINLAPSGNMTKGYAPATMSPSPLFTPDYYERKNVKVLNVAAPGAFTLNTTNAAAYRINPTAGAGLSLGWSAAPVGDPNNVGLTGVKYRVKLAWAGDATGSTVITQSAATITWTDAQLTSLFNLNAGAGVRNVLVTYSVEAFDTLFDETAYRTQSNTKTVAVYLEKAPEVPVVTAPANNALVYLTSTPTLPITWNAFVDSNNTTTATGMLDNLVARLLVTTTKQMTDGTVLTPNTVDTISVTGLTTTTLSNAKLLGYLGTNDSATISVVLQVSDLASDNFATAAFMNQSTPVLVTITKVGTATKFFVNAVPAISSGATDTTLIAGVDKVTIYVVAKDLNGNLVRNITANVTLKALLLDPTPTQSFIVKSGTTVLGSRTDFAAGKTVSLPFDANGQSVITVVDNKAEGRIYFTAGSDTTKWVTLTPPNLGGFKWIPGPVASYTVSLLTTGDTPTDSAWVNKPFHVRIIPVDAFGNTNTTQTVAIQMSSPYPDEFVNGSLFSGIRSVTGPVTYELVPKVVRVDQKLVVLNGLTAAQLGASGNLRVLAHYPTLPVITAPAAPVTGIRYTDPSTGNPFSVAFQWSASTDPANLSGWVNLPREVITYRMKFTGPTGVSFGKPADGDATGTTATVLGSELVNILVGLGKTNTGLTWVVYATDGTTEVQSASKTVNFARDLTSVSTTGEVPKEFGLNQNYPNPFNPTTTIRFALPKEAPVTLEVYNMLGEKVRTLVNGQTMSAGYFDVTWDGKDNAGQVSPSGVYFYRMVAGDFVKTLKMMMMK